MKPLSSRLKIALLSAAISGVVLLGFGMVMWLLICHQRLATVDRELRSLASRHPGLFAGRGSFERLASSLEFTFGGDYTNRIILLLQDAGGRTLYRSLHWPATLDAATLDLKLATNSTVTVSTSGETGRGRGGRGFGIGRGGPPPDLVFNRIPRFFTARTPDSAWRIGVLGNDEMTMVLGLNQDQVQGELNQVRNTFLLTLPFALFLVGLGGWIVAGRALRPLKAIADTAERITARGLDQRIPAATESPEAARVIHVLNRMMNRLETSFLQATRFSADASHELKTPLAVMQGELENAVQAATPGSSEQLLFTNLLEETQRLKTITRSLLLLAQADAGELILACEVLDLSAELEGIIEDARVLAADSRLRFDVGIQAGILVKGDRGLLRTAIFNLISNAIKHNEPDGKIEVRLAAAGDKINLAIGNTGPGIPAADQPKIFERFYRVGRGNAPRVDGVGLGLSLAREIVRAHSGELSLTESRSEWTCFTVSLPAGTA